MQSGWLFDKIDPMENWSGGVMEYWGVYLQSLLHHSKTPSLQGNSLRIELGDISTSQKNILSHILSLYGIHLTPASKHQYSF